MFPKLTVKEQSLIKEELTASQILVLESSAEVILNRLEQFYARSTGRNHQKLAFIYCVYIAASHDQHVTRLLLNRLYGQDIGLTKQIKAFVMLLGKILAGNEQEHRVISSVYSPQLMVDQSTATLDKIRKIAGNYLQLAVRTWWENKAQAVGLSPERLAILNRNNQLGSQEHVSSVRFAHMR